MKTWTFASHLYPASTPVPPEILVQLVLFFSQDFLQKITENSTGGNLQSHKTGKSTSRTDSRLHLTQ